MPGFIDTPMVQTVPEKVMNLIMSNIPLRRKGTPEEVAEVRVSVMQECYRCSVF